MITKRGLGVFSILSLVFSLFSIFSLNFVLGGIGDSSRTGDINFNVNNGNCIVSGVTPLITLYPRSCSSDGSWYCPGNGSEALNTSLPNGACYMSDGTLAGENCCPDKKVCSVNGCITSCSAYTSKSTCPSDCYWDGTKCNNVRFIVCSQYTTNETCENDRYNVRLFDCNTTRSGPGGLFVEPNSCKCKWGTNITGAPSCNLNYTIWSPTPTPHVTFICSKSYVLGNCSEDADHPNQQKLTWTANANPATTTAAEKTEAGCVEGERWLECGQKPLKVPGFGLFNFITVLMIISIIYGFYLKNKE